MTRGGRQEVPEAVRKCQLAGITVRMITGDNILTATSISREIGILTSGRAIEGPDFRRMTPEEQREVLKTMQVRGPPCLLLYSILNFPKIISVS